MESQPPPPPQQTSSCWLKPFAQMDLLTQYHFREAFCRLAGTVSPPPPPTTSQTSATGPADRYRTTAALDRIHSIANTTATAADEGGEGGGTTTRAQEQQSIITQHLLTQTPGEIQFESLPTMLAIMNMSLTLDDLREPAPRFAAMSLEELNRVRKQERSSAGGGGAVGETQQDDDDGIMYVTNYDLTFAFSSVVALYDSLLEWQNGLIVDLLGFFDLLDEGGRGVVKLSDLRHALCRLGDTPLTDAEYNHMLYRHKLLHKASISIFEFVRLVMDVPVDAVVESVVAATAAAAVNNVAVAA